MESKENQEKVTKSFATNFTEHGWVEDAKIIRFNGGTFKLPDECGSTKKYIRINDDLVQFISLREYGDDHRLKLEVAYHREPTILPGGKPVLHYHIVVDDGDKFSYGKPILIKKGDEMHKKYRKYLVGINL